MCTEQLAAEQQKVELYKKGIKNARSMILQYQVLTDSLVSLNQEYDMLAEQENKRYLESVEDYNKLSNRYNVSLGVGVALGIALAISLILR